MATAAQKLLVVGGNGFLGSAICKAAVVAGWEVSSMSSSGKPYTTPAGHTPPWVHRVTWHRASAFEPDRYRDIISDRTAVVHSLGILLEDAGYKQAIKDGNVLRVAKAIGSSLFGGPAPLRGKEEMRRGYEGMNRDSALTVLDTYLSQLTSSSSHRPASKTSSSTTPDKAFVYISAADAFRPLIPARYLETKREAEAGIASRCAEHAETGFRGLYMRPGLMYHPHTRPLSTLPSFLLSCTASLHDTLGANQLPLSPSNPVAQAARALQTHPLHVDHVASAVLRSIVEGRQGVVDVPTMRAWAGFKVKGQQVKVDESVDI